MRLIATLLITGLAATSFAADKEIPNYFPLSKGTKWEYRVRGDELEMAVLCEITEAELKNGKTHARLEAKFPNAVTVGEELATDARGVYRTAMLGARLTQPLPIIRYPIKASDTWKEKLKVGEIEGTCSIVIKDIAATIEVPAGKFTTLWVESMVEIKGEKVTSHIWYADGVGIVKQETIAGPRIVSMELKKFWPSK